MRKTRGPERMRRQGNRTSSRCTELGKETAHQPDLHYVEGWRVIAEANRNFGYDVWSGAQHRSPPRGASLVVRKQRRNR